MEEEIFFEGLDKKGAAFGFLGSKKIIAYGVLPNEKAKVRIIGKKKGVLVARVEEILEKSKWRVKERESHFLSCSPWQIFDYKFQIESKKKFLKEAFSFLKENFVLNDFFESKKKIEYREKMEFSFIEEESRIYLAFYERGNSKVKVKLNDGCILMKPQAKELALYLIQEINRQKINPAILKSLIIRTNSLNELVFALLFKDENFSFNVKIEGSLNGYIFAYSSPLSPASVFQKILKKEGDVFLKEKIKDKYFYYNYDSFFQNNLETFSLALEIMRESVSFPLNKIVDFYGGVGIIGISLSDLAKKVIGIEINSAASYFSLKNAQINDVKNYEAVNLPAEKVDNNLLEDADLVIFDPPRSGLNPRIIKKLIQFKPQFIFYLSCNPFTQAKDIFLLKDYYKIKKIYGFDFYPQTPHLESLVILERK